MPENLFTPYASMVTLRASAEVNGEVVTAMYRLPRPNWEQAVRAGAEDAIWSYVHSSLSEAVMSSLTVATRLDQA